MNLHLLFQINLFIDESTKLVNSVFDRLGSADISLEDTELWYHWTAINKEMKNKKASTYRKIEAMLGFNPDEASEDVMKAFLSKAKDIGNSAVEELASAMANQDNNPAESLLTVERAALDGVVGKFDIPNIHVEKILHQGLEPWEIGRQLALETRNACVTKDVVSDDVLCDLMGLTKDNLFHNTGYPPLTLGIIDQGTGKSSITFRGGKSRQARRFIASRIVGDKLIAKTDKWLPVSKAATVRQKIQRSFAAEFLCPFDILHTFLDGKYDEDSLAEAADYFSVDESVPRTHLVNNDILDPIALQNVI
jgi:hypothetical protein